MRDGDLEVVLLTLLFEAAFIALLLSPDRATGGYPLATIVGGLVCCSVPLLLRSLRLIFLPKIIISWIFLVLFVHALGVLFGMYDTIWWWDSMTHLIASSLIAAIFVVLILAFWPRDVKNGFDTLLIYALVLSFIATVGVVWELFEFFSDGLLLSTMQYSLVDTGMDLTFDLIGVGTTMVLFPYLWPSSSSKIGSELLADGRLSKILSDHENGPSRSRSPDEEA